MTDISIRAENLGKLYRIGPRQRYRTLPTLSTTPSVRPSVMFVRRFASLRVRMLNRWNVPTFKPSSLATMATFGP